MRLKAAGLAVCLTGILCLAGGAFAEGGLTFGIEQESWVTEMDLSSDSFQIMQVYSAEPVPGFDYSTREWWIYDLQDRAHFQRSFLTLSYPMGKLRVYGKVGISRLYPELKWMEGVAIYERWKWDAQEQEHYLDRFEEFYAEGGFLIDDNWWLPVDLGRKEGTGSAYSVGLDVTLASTPTWSLVLNAEYTSQQDSDVGAFFFGYADFERDGETMWLSDKFIYDLDTDSATSTQYCLSLLGKAKCGSCMPYAGVRWSPVTTTYSGEGTFEYVEHIRLDEAEYAISESVPFEYTMKSKDDIGLIGGCDFYLGDGWQGNFELFIQGDWGMCAAIRKEL